MNKTFITGHLGNDAELSETPKGTPVVNFNLACKLAKKDEAEWYKVSWFGENAQTLSTYLVTGIKVLVEGRVSAESWTDKETGEAKHKLLLRAYSVELCSKKEEESINEDEVENIFK